MPRCGPGWQVPAVPAYTTARLAMTCHQTCSLVRRSVPALQSIVPFCAGWIFFADHVPLVLAGALSCRPSSLCAVHDACRRSPCTIPYLSALHFALPPLSADGIHPGDKTHRCHTSLCASPFHPAFRFQPSLCRWHSSRWQTRHTVLSFPTIVHPVSLVPVIPQMVSIPKTRPGSKCWTGSRRCCSACWRRPAANSQPLAQPVAAAAAAAPAGVAQQAIASPRREGSPLMY